MTWPFGFRGAFQYILQDVALLMITLGAFKPGNKYRKGNYTNLQNYQTFEVNTAFLFLQTYRIYFCFLAQMKKTDFLV